MKSFHARWALLGIAAYLAGVGTGLALDRAVPGAARAASDLRGTEAAVERGDLPPAEQVALMRSIAQAHLDRKDYANAIAWAQRFLKAGGAEAEVRPLLVQAYFRGGDFANAARELQWEIQAAERAGRAPGEDRLLLLRTCYARLNDQNAYSWALEKLVTWYPRADYWGDLLDRLEKRPDVGSPYALDLYRLRLRTGVVSDAAGYLKAAALAQQAGYPAEAKAMVEQGMARGVLGTGADAPQHRQLLQQLAREAQAQQRQLADPQAAAAAERAKDGIELLDLGFAYVTQREFARGLELMEQGLRKGGGLGGRPQFAKLHLGIAYLMAGQKVRAIEIFTTVGGRHGGADLGRIWALHARNPG